MKAAILCSMVTVALVCTACMNNEGNVEKAGKRIDEAVDNVKDGENPLHRKGAAEKAGEAVDNAVDKAAGNK